VGSNTIPTLTADEATTAGLSTQQVSDATSLYAAKCMRCHKFYEPTDYSQQEWDTWLHKMSRKSKLKPAQEELLTRYLAAYRAKQIPAALK
jgi:nitrate/TMAO reductase-like tetraheme cytochrome c subunit